MVSLPGGEMETLKSSTQESLRTRREKKLRQVGTNIPHYQVLFVSYVANFVVPNIYLSIDFDRL